jgi:hypothetical protein
MPFTATQIATSRSLLSYSAVLAAIAAAILAFRHEQYKNRLRRQGIARLLYLKLLQCQSMLATAYYSHEWWAEDDFPKSYLSDEDIKRVATALRANEWRVVNSALGWTEHLRARHRSKGATTRLGPDDLNRIHDIYEKLELARWALRRVCGRRLPSLLEVPRWVICRARHLPQPALWRMPWDVHNQADALSSATEEKPTVLQMRLANTSKQICRAELTKRRASDEMPCEICGHQHEPSRELTPNNKDNVCITECTICPDDQAASADTDHTNGVITRRNASPTSRLAPTPR